MSESIKSILIFRQSPDGKRFFLSEDGNLSSNRCDAAVHWDIQFEAIVAENPILSMGGDPASQVVLLPGALGSSSHL